MDLYQFHSPTLVGSSVGIIRILYIIYISRIRGIFTWYIMMHLSLIVYVYFNLYVIVQNIGFVKQRPDGLFHGFHSFHTSVCLRPVVKTGVECSGVYTCTHTEGFPQGDYHPTCNVVLVVLVLEVLVLDYEYLWWGGSGSGRTSTLELAAMCCRYYWIIL